MASAERRGRESFPFLVGRHAVTKCVASQIFVVLALAGAPPETPFQVRASEPPKPGLHDVSTPLRNVRVLIAAGVTRLRVRAESALIVRDHDLKALGRFESPDWTVVAPADSGEVRLGGHSWLTPSLWIEPVEHGPLTVSVEQDGEWLDGVPYPGALRVVIREDGWLDGINHVDVERYVACVTGVEVWPTFDVEAYRAQAIVARTYVLYQMMRRQGAAFDVSATQGSQVYRGIRENGSARRAAAAVRHTQGLVLTWMDDGRDRLFCTYYSATCGGRSQSAAIFGSEGDIEPLAGGVSCDYCKIAPGSSYRWGPVHLSKDRIRSKLVGRDPELKSLGHIRRIEVSKRTPSGRPVTLRILGSRSDPYEMLAERFRLIVAPNEVRSTDFKVRDAGDEVVFEHGRGFGHGLGLCQWGMQGQALQGRRASEILRYYYPGSRLTRAY